MDYAELLADAGNYTRDALLANPIRWAGLIACVLCLGIPFHGYLVRVYRGADPAPAAGNAAGLLIDGLKVLFIVIVYLLPILLALVVLVLFIAFTYYAAPGGVPGIAGGILGAVFDLVCYLFQFILVAILPVAFIRFARTGQVTEAFNFGAIRETIGRIGWITYLIAVILIALVIGVPLLLILFIAGMVLAITYAVTSSTTVTMLVLAALFGLILILVIPVAGLLAARYLSRVYDAAGPEAPAVPPAS